MTLFCLQFGHDAWMLYFGVSKSAQMYFCSYAQTRVRISHWSGGPRAVKFMQDQLEFSVVGPADQLLKSNDANDALLYLVHVKSEKVGPVSFWQGQWASSLTELRVSLVLLASSKHCPNSKPGTNPHKCISGLGASFQEIKYWSRCKVLLY